MHDTVAWCWKNNGLELFFVMFFRRWVNRLNRYHYYMDCGIGHASCSHLYCSATVLPINKGKTLLLLANVKLVVPNT